MKGTVYRNRMPAKGYANEKERVGTAVLDGVLTCGEPAGQIRNTGSSSGALFQKRNIDNPCGHTLNSFTNRYYPPSCHCHIEK